MKQLLNAVHFCVILTLIAVCCMPCSEAEVTYQLGPETDLLDAAFYAERTASFPRVANDGRTVVFVEYHPASAMTAVFLVDLGDPSSWRRLSGDFSTTIPATNFSWTPDDAYIFGANLRCDATTGVYVEQRLLYGYEMDASTATRRATDNWLVGKGRVGADITEIIAVPILNNGDLDSSRELTFITDLAPSGIVAEWPSVARDGTAVTFVHLLDWPAPPQPEVADVYVLKNLQTIISAPKRPGTNISTLAPTTLTDPNVVAIRTSETNNFAHTPHFSEDMSRVFFTEDQNNTFNADDFLGTVNTSDFDLMISNSDGSGADFRIPRAGNQFAANPTPGGMRILYTRGEGGAFHIYAATLEVSTDISGTTMGDPADNDIVTAIDQQASDASGTVVDVCAGTAIDFPPGEEQEVRITTPINPVSAPELPPAVEGIPVVRDFGPDGTTFFPPIEVTITYTDAEVEGFDEANLRVFQFNPDTGIYDLEITTIVSRDLLNNTIVFELDHFSTVGVGASTTDTDGDGIDNSSDPDDDNDGVPDEIDPFPLDTDDDGISNLSDPDDDCDGIPDAVDEFPFDTDNDGDPNASDPDDDRDGIDDILDAFPFDTDNDGERNDADTDDDGDGVSDALELVSGTDPLDPAEFPDVPAQRASTLAALVVLLAVLGALRARTSCQAERNGI